MAPLSLESDVRQEESLLLQFIYQCPVGLAEVDNRGAIRLLNALGVALLMPMAGGAGLDNFFDIMRPCASEMVDLVETCSAIGEIFATVGS
jgi:hypothetical protein